jgi:hypothetical protein
LNIVIGNMGDFEGMHGEIEHGHNSASSTTPKMELAQPSGGAWRAAAVRNRKRAARVLSASHDFVSEWGVASKVNLS